MPKDNDAAPAGPAPGAVAGRVAPVVMEPNTPFYYGKAVTAEDFTKTKLYMKGTIWVGGIPFTDTTDAWNYMLGIPDDKRRAEVAEDLGHQFVLLAGKMGDGYLTFSFKYEHQATLNEFLYFRRLDIVIILCREVLFWMQELLLIGWAVSKRAYSFGVMLES